MGYTLPPLRGWGKGWPRSQGCATRSAWLALGCVLTPLRGWGKGWPRSQGCATRSAWLALGYTLPPLAGLRTSFVRTSRTSDISSRLFQRQRRVTYQPGPQGQEIGPKTAKRAEGPKHGHASRNELSDTFRGCGSAAPGYVLTPLRGCVAALCSQHEPRKEVTGHRDPASCGAPRVRTIPFAEMRSHDDRLNGLTTRRCNALMASMPSWNTRRP